MLPFPCVPPPGTSQLILQPAFSGQPRQPLPSNTSAINAQSCLKQIGALAHLAVHKAFGYLCSFFVFQQPHEAGANVIPLHHKRRLRCQRSCGLSKAPQLRHKWCRSEKRGSQFCSTESLHFIAPQRENLYGRKEDITECWGMS